MEKKVSIIVVTYNRCDLLKECLTALLAQSYLGYKIFLINNGSTDDTDKMIKSEFSDKRISYYNTHKNLGGAGGFNFGMKKAMLEQSDYMWLMDDDTIVHKDSLEKLVSKAKELNDDFGFLSGCVMFTDDSMCKMNIPMPYEKGNVDWINLKNEIRLKSATFVSFFIKSSVVYKIGYPIREFFIWADDTEYSLRVSQKYPCFFCPESIVTHKMKLNSAASDKDLLNCEDERIERYFFAYRNRFYIAKTNGVKKIVFYLIKFFFIIIKIVFSKTESKALKLKTIFKGFNAGIHFNPEIEYVQEERLIQN